MFENYPPLARRLTVLEVRSAAFEYDDFDVRIYFD